MRPFIDLLRLDATLVKSGAAVSPRSSGFSGTPRSRRRSGTRSWRMRWPCGKPSGLDLVVPRSHVRSHRSPAHL